MLEIQVRCLEGGVLSVIAENEQSPLLLRQMLEYAVHQDVHAHHGGGPERSYEIANDKSVSRNNFDLRRR